MARRKEEVLDDPVTNLKGFPIHYDEKTTENFMRRVSVRDMMALAKRPDAEDRLLLHEELAQAKPNEDIIEVLLEVEPARIKKCKPGSGCLPIHIACLNIHSISSEILIILLDAWPESIKTPCLHGFLPLHKAVCANVIGKNPPNITNISMILEAHPEAVYMQNSIGQTPLHCALEAKKLFSDVIDLIIQASGKKICSVVDRYGSTPLHKAVTRKKGAEENLIIETLVENEPGACMVSDHLGMLPLHWAVSKLEPVLDVLIELLDAFPYGIFHRDNTGKLPVDRILAFGNQRCGSSMNYLNTIYEQFSQKRKAVIKMWEEDFLGNAPHVSKLKAPNQAPRPTPYAFGAHDWCLNELNNTERQMALIIFRGRLQRKLLCSDDEAYVYLLLLRHVFVQRGGKVECFGPSLAETNGGGPVKGPLAKWWLAKIVLPDWDPSGNMKSKKQR